jgi:hypothetical protein
MSSRFPYFIRKKDLISRQLNYRALRSFIVKRFLQNVLNSGVRRLWEILYRKNNNGKGYRRINLKSSSLERDCFIFLMI